MKPRPGFDNWRQPVGQTVNAVSGLPERAKQSIPSPPYLKKSSYESTGFFVLHTAGMRSPDQGVDNWRQPVGQAMNGERAAQGERSESIPPSPPYLKKSSYESTGFFFVYCTHRVPPPTSVRARGNRAHQLSGYSVNNQNAQESTEHICIIWSLPITSSLIKMPPTEIHVTCHHKIVMPEESTIEKIVN